MKISPLQQVKASFGSKEKLIEKITSKLEKHKEESDSGFKKRLLKVSSRKLLRLQTREASGKK